MSQASEVELLMLDLINEERASRGIAPLAINNALNASSEDHSAWMLGANVFNHTGSDGSSATQRIMAADYALEGRWGTAENLGWQSERGAPGIEDDVRDIHQGLMESPGHRANILNPDLEDIGIGIETGPFTTGGQTYDAVMITQNFGTSDAANSNPTEEVAPPVVAVEEAPEVIELAEVPDDMTDDPMPVMEDDEPLVPVVNDADDEDVTIADDPIDDAPVENEPVDEEPADAEPLDAEPVGAAPEDDTPLDEDPVLMPVEVPEVAEMPDVVDPPIVDMPDPTPVDAEIPLACADRFDFFSFDDAPWQDAVTLDVSMVCSAQDAMPVRAVWLPFDFDLLETLFDGFASGQFSCGADTDMM